MQRKTKIRAARFILWLTLVLGHRAWTRSCTVGFSKWHFYHDVMKADLGFSVKDHPSGFHRMKLKLPLALVLSHCLVNTGLVAGRAAPATIQVFFSPKGGCTEAVVDALSKARSTVLVQAYSFTSTPIAKALVDAHRRA